MKVYCSKVVTRESGALVKDPRCTLFVREEDAVKDYDTTSAVLYSLGFELDEEKSGGFPYLHAKYCLGSIRVFLSVEEVEVK